MKKNVKAYVILTGNGVKQFSEQKESDLRLQKVQLVVAILAFVCSIAILLEKRKSEGKTRL